MNPLFDRQRQYRVTGFVLFLMMAALVLTRILTNLLSRVITTAAGAVMLDVFSSIFLQIGCLLVMPTLLYKFLLKKPFKQTLKFTNVRKCDYKLMIVAFLIGVALLIVTIGVSLFWQMFLYVVFGYAPPISYGTSLWPEMGGVGSLFYGLLFTAVFPGICEEVASRGGLLTTLRGSHKEGATVVLGGLIFGLFHQYAPQFFYTAISGGVMVYLVLKSKSIIPSMIVHFTNNAVSVYLDVAEEYGWWGGNFTRWISDMLGSGLENPQNIGIIFGLFFGTLVALAGLIYLFKYLSNRARLKQIEETVKVVESGENIEVDPDKGVIGAPLSDTVLYKPTMRDRIFFIGAITLSVLSTVFSIIWGIL